MTPMERLVQWQGELGDDAQTDLSFNVECRRVYSGPAIILTLRENNRHSAAGNTDLLHTVTEYTNVKDFDFAVYRALLRWGRMEFDPTPNGGP